MSILKVFCSKTIHATLVLVKSLWHKLHLCWFLHESRIKPLDYNVNNSGLLFCLSLKCISTAQPSLEFVLTCCVYTMLPISYKCL